MKVAVIGAGYVGLVAAVALAHAGHSVCCVEIDSYRLSKLGQAEVPFYEEGLEELLRDGLKSGRLTFTAQMSEALPADVGIIAVGTPSSPNGHMDLSYVYAAVDELMRTATRPMTIVMKSTVPPGTGEAIRRRILPRSAMPIEYVANPEFLREGKALLDWFHPDRIVIGASSQAAAEEIKALYEGISAPVYSMDVTSAEMVKMASNAFLAMKISFINEIANVCEALGANIHDVAHAVGQDRRIGPEFLKAGVGYGGSCFPKDIRAFKYLSDIIGYDFQLLTAVAAVNARQRMRVVTKLKTALGTLADRYICVLGLAFKPGTDDVRESPALDIIPALLDAGAKVTAVDPMATSTAKALLPREVQLTQDPYEAVSNAHAIVLLTEWPELTGLDWARVKKLAGPDVFVLDGRNALDHSTMNRLGFRYSGIGQNESRPQQFHTAP